MAESAAHHTLTNEAKPSIFEIIAQDSLNSTLYPAFHKITQFLAASFPNTCNKLPKYSDETFLLLKALLECNYLSKKDASFSEYFYGLKRCPASKETLNTLNRTQRYLSTFILVIAPYVKRKLDAKIEQYKLQTLDGIYRNDLEKKIKKSVISLHSTGEFFWKIWTFVQYLRYLMNKTEVQLPTLSILNLKLVYSDEARHLSGFWSALFRNQLSASEIASGIVQNGLASLLEISAFFLQFLKVWNNEKMNYNIAALPKVPPPELHLKSEVYQGKCPLCLQKQKIPTVVPVSGFVFCFSCILRHLKETSKCPVTNLPASYLDIVRIYDESS